ncbi:MAG: hypothetical protein EZS28_003122 [Streblomastix strix]|uniref:Uncharacterized protein n=1 Tax=Streblomastix strix TaxID=222440 RepID=A0A5J4X253_9EUKA|nr:MAG: hypothetical protein EZS28_003122 [Streblomastix strix]
MYFGHTHALQTFHKIIRDTIEYIPSTFTDQVRVVLRISAFSREVCLDSESVIQVSMMVLQHMHEPETHINDQEN